VHTVAFSTDTVPLLQFWHSVLVENVPALHITHDVISSLLSVDPGGHTLQFIVASILDADPGSHSLQSVAPVMLLYFPRGHG
jgi:hypothetical protein